MNAGWLADRRGLRIALVAVVVGGVLAIAWGGGYSAARAVTNDGSAWLRKGDTIVHINGPAARYDATVPNSPVALAASSSDDLEVVQEPNGQVFTADPTTHKVYRIDLSTMNPQLAPSGTDVLAAGGVTLVVDQGNGTVVPFNPATLTPAQPIKVPGGINSQAIAGNGAAYVGSQNGTVTVIRGGKASTRRVAPSHTKLYMSVVGTEPVAVDSAHSQLYVLGAGKAKPVQIPGVPNSPVAVDPDLPGGVLWMARGNELVKVQLSGTFTPFAVALPANDTFGGPVVNSGRVYVPDDTANTVLVFDANTMNQVGRIAVPAGAPGQTNVEILVKDGKVWIDDPTSSEAVVVSPSGPNETVYKGTGDGVFVPGKSTHGKAKAKAPTPARSKTTGSDHGTPGSPGPTQPVSSAPPGPPPVEVTPVTAPPVTAPAVTAPAVTAPPVTVPPAVPPVTPPPTTTTTTTTTTVPPSTAAPTPTKVTVPSDFRGKTPNAACNELANDTLFCSPTDKGVAPEGTAPGLVTAVPREGQSVPRGTKVEVDYYSSTPVPKFQSGEDPNTYCQAADKAGFHCTPTNLGTGNPTSQVVSTNPAVGTPEPAGTQLQANYYGTAPITVPQPSPGEDPNSYCATADSEGFACSGSDQGAAPSGVTPDTVTSTNPAAGTAVAYGTALTAYYYGEVTVPNCVGVAVNQCAMPAGLAAAWAAAATTEFIPCNLGYAQSNPAGQAVAAGTTLTIDYDPACPTPVYEWVLCNTHIHWLSTSNSPPSGSTVANCPPSAPNDTWAPYNSATSAGNANTVGEAFVAGDGKDTSGLTPVVELKYGSKPTHYLFTNNSSVEATDISNGWQFVRIAFYSSASAGPLGSVQMFGEQLQAPPQDWAWFGWNFQGQASGLNWYDLP